MAMSAALVVAAVAICLLVLSGLWAERRFRRFDQLPAHFDFAGRATRMASRSFVVWLAPSIFIAILGLTVFLAYAMPADQLNGDPGEAIVYSSVIILGAQIFVLWLIDRWSRRQE
ncbi:MAG: DUF1648 domain-containing protein [Pseudomonadota bacterium]